MKIVVNGKETDVDVPADITEFQFAQLLQDEKCAERAADSTVETHAGELKRFQRSQPGRS